jgi:signal transduction histidine kinase
LFHRDTELLFARGFSMPAADASPDGIVYDPLDQLRHDLKTPLTTISGHAYLLARSVRRSSSLSDEERARMLDGVATIEAMVLGMVALIDAMRGGGGEGGTDPA